MTTHIRRAYVSVVVAMVALGLWYGLYPRPNGPARVGWKNRAIEAIRAECNSGSDIRFVTSITPSTSRERAPTDLPWISDTRITMTNGEWVVFRNICQKEDFRVQDLFICKASDGRWYFSTFHFCIGMSVFRYGAAMDGQPGSLHGFAAQYTLEPFDPESDRCLRKTSNTVLVE